MHGICKRKNISSNPRLRASEDQENPPRTSPSTLVIAVIGKAKPYH
jgi:hypothetical protein